jgi:hypothetical protein
MPQEVDHCEFCKLRNSNYVEWECTKGHEILWSKTEKDQMNIECIVPLKKIVCPDYKKGIAYTLDDIREMLGMKGD